MDNVNFSGEWTGHFRQAENGTEVIFTESINLKKWWLYPFALLYLKLQQKRYIVNGSTNYIIRHLQGSENHLLREFLYEAIYIPEGVKPPSKDVVDLPELKLYIEDFGKKKDDFCLVADCEGKVVGAVWVRIMNDYGHVDDRTPSLSISLYKEYRSKGIGSHLMREMFRLLESKGYSRVSLSVQKANYAARMYLKLGFKVINETEEEFVMLKDLSLSN